MFQTTSELIDTLIDTVFKGEELEEEDLEDLHKMKEVVIQEMSFLEDAAIECLSKLAKAQDLQNAIAFLESPSYLALKEAKPIMDAYVKSKEDEFQRRVVKRVEEYLKAKDSQGT